MPGINIVLPGFLFWVALLYAGLGTLITHLNRASADQPVFSASAHGSRFPLLACSLARLREYTEQVALLNGEAAEQNMVEQRFGALIATRGRCGSVG